MTDPRFFSAAGPFSVAELCARLDLTPPEGPLGMRTLVGVAPLDTAGPGHLAFLDNPKYRAAAGRTSAGACLVRPTDAALLPPETVALTTPAPYAAFGRAAALFHPEPASTGEVHATAVIDPTAELGVGTEVGPLAVIGAGARLGPGCVIGPHAVIGPGVELGAGCRVGAHVTISHALVGARVTILPGARLGQPGFGFTADAKGFVRIPQLGRVIVGDDVEIGANVTIDRGAAGDTIIGRGTMIDNLVQIGHNVEVGPGCILVAQVGISGSSKLGPRVVLGGQVGVAGHLTLGAGARVAAKSGITRDVPAGAEMMGIPARPRMQYLREAARLARLAKLKGRDE